MALPDAQPGLFTISWRTWRMSGLSYHVLAVQGALSQFHGVEALVPVRLETFRTMRRV